MIKIHSIGSEKIKSKSTGMEDPGSDGTSVPVKL